MTEGLPSNINSTFKKLIPFSILSIQYNFINHMTLLYIGTCPTLPGSVEPYTAEH